MPKHSGTAPLEQEPRLNDFLGITLWVGDIELAAWEEEEVKK